ncbi:hypothetical protein BDP81DRAFT_423086 [Colletotrichum phormii]|uniref:Secreted protein n=1 Tax=Colletotrichum phormii TaxID=359342 RepID=A0AAI9ZVL7_9PEZI|nr:uncharacterized protein BDP81DRAFT_423086 [Colletotrichum phormii]KAK1638983.1 hypothetical protein BDP81DRAFT_423086 [Colletotrichum phormii]
MPTASRPQDTVLGWLDTLVVLLVPTVPSHPYVDPGNTSTMAVSTSSVGKYPFLPPFRDSQTSLLGARSMLKEGWGCVS